MEYPNHYHQYFEGFRPSAASEDPENLVNVESKAAQGLDKNVISNALLAKQKELDELKNRAMEKDQELRALDSTLIEKSEERKAEIQGLKKDLGSERQAWMTTGNE